METEYDIYEYLGLHPSVLKFFFTVHNLYNFKGTSTTGKLEEMRSTGEVTTALGNVITNM